MTLEPAALIISDMCSGSSRGLMGFDMPAACAPQIAKCVCGRIGKTIDTAFSEPMPRLVSRLAV